MKRVKDNHFAGLGHVTRGNSSGTGNDLAAVINKIAIVAYPVTAADETANEATVVTGLTAASRVIVQVRDASGQVKTADAIVTVSGGSVTVADGSTYDTVETDVITIWAFDATGEVA